MRILIDECLPLYLKDEYKYFEVTTVTEMGWSGKSDSELFDLISEQFDVFITIHPMANRRNWAGSSTHCLQFSYNGNIRESLRNADVWQHTLVRIDARLYELSIDILDISEPIKFEIHRTGITTIGDCLDHFDRVGGGMILHFPKSFWHAMHDVVEPKLIEMGYLDTDWREN